MFSKDSIILCLDRLNFDRLNFIIKVEMRITKLNYFFSQDLSVSCCALTISVLHAHSSYGTKPRKFLTVISTFVAKARMYLKTDHQSTGQ